MPIVPPAPSGLSVSFVDLDGNLLISWSYESNSSGPGFIVERALEADGPWSTVRFTTANSIKDRIDDGLRHCYRVTVLRSTPSGAVCVVRPEKL